MVYCTGLENPNSPSEKFASPRSVAIGEARKRRVANQKVATELSLRFVARFFGNNSATAFEYGLRPRH